MGAAEPLPPRIRDVEGWFLAGSRNLLLELHAKSSATAGKPPTLLTLFFCLPEEADERKQSFHALLLKGAVRFIQDRRHRDQRLDTLETDGPESRFESGGHEDE